MRVADWIIEFLENAGIDHCFTVVGGGSIFLNDALAKAKKMRYVCVHHEQAAGMAAEAYARVRNGIGLAIVTSGPGGTNAITGIAGAWTDNVPMIVISGQVFSGQTIGNSGVRTKGVQEINIVDMVRPITKYAVMVTDAKDIGWILKKAIYVAVKGRPGPTWIDVPANLQNAEIDPRDFKSEPFFDADYDALFLIRPISESLDEIAELVRLLKHAKRPLIHVGQGVRLSNAEREFFYLVNFHNIPFVTARNANDICASDHDYYVGRPGTFAQRGANFAVQTCDLYIAIGTRLSLAQTGYNAKDYARNATKVMVDIDRAELDKDTVPIDLKIHADCRAFLAELLRQMGSENIHGSPEWLGQCKTWQRKYPPVTQAMRDESGYVNSYHFIDVLSDALVASDVIVTDMGYAFQNTHQAFKVKIGQRLMTNCGLAAMGWGLPAAVGACIGSGRRTIAIVGDGGLMMNLQELATIAHHRLPIKIFVLNNGGYLTMRQSQAHAFDQYMGSDEDTGISFPNFRHLAESFRIDYEKIFIHDFIEEFIAAFLADDGPGFCEIMMSPTQEQAPKSINRRLADGTIQQTAIEDAYPFLDPAEIAEQMEVAK